MNIDFCEITGISNPFDIPKLRDDQKNLCEGLLSNIREFKITTTATATATSLNKRFDEQNNSCARAL